MGVYERRWCVGAGGVAGGAQTPGEPRRRYPLRLHTPHGRWRDSHDSSTALPASHPWTSGFDFESRIRTKGALTVGVTPKFYTLWG